MRVVLLAALLLTSALAGATTLRRLSVAELTASADLVAVVTVMGQSTRWERPEGGRIVTQSDVRLDEVWLGASRPGETAQVITWGGMVDGLGQRVAGEAHLAVGERLVLFLAKDSGTTFYPVGLAQGAMHLEGEKLVALGDGTRLVGNAPALPFDLPTLRLEVRALGARR